MATVLHITPFIWTMGYRKGIFCIEAYKSLETYGYKVLFVVPNMHVFNPQIIINNTLVKQAGLHGIVFKLNKKMCTLVETGTIISKFIWFLYYMLKSFYISLKLLTEVRDVVCIYAHTWLAVPPAYILGKLFRIPCVYRVYGVHNYSIALGENVIKCLSKPDLLIFKIPCDAYVISNDGTMGKAVAMRMGVPEQKILFIPDGVPDDFFISFESKESTRSELKFFGLDVPSEKKILLYVGRIVGWKGIDRLIGVMKLIKEKNPAIDICLLIAGDGVLRYHHEELTRRLNLSDNIIFLGGVERGQLKKLFASCDIYLTLQDLTNFSNSLIEAMASGVCVVAGNIGSTGEIIKNMENGILVPLYDLKRTADLIVYLLSNDNLRYSLGIEARKYAKTHFLVWKDRIKYELDWISNMLHSIHDSHKNIKNYGRDMV